MKDKCNAQRVEAHSEQQEAALARYCARHNVSVVTRYTTCTHYTVANARGPVYARARLSCGCVVFYVQSRNAWRRVDYHAGRACVCQHSGQGTWVNIMRRVIGKGRTEHNGRGAYDMYVQGTFEEVRKRVITYTNNARVRQHVVDLQDSKNELVVTFDTTRHEYYRVFVVVGRDGGCRCAMYCTL